MGREVMIVRLCWERPSGPERTTAPARLLGVGVVEDEPLGQQLGVVVENGALQEQVALLVHVDLGAVVLEDLVAQPRLTLPREGVAEPRASTPLHANAEPPFADALFGHQRLDLPRGRVGDLDHGIIRRRAARWPPPTRPSSLPASSC